MKRVALLGSPIDHSLSPAIHNAAFRELELPWRYQSIETHPETLNEILAMLRTPTWVGANVTLPLKTTVLQGLDRLTDQASAIGAVNTIFKEGTRLVGENTDAPGFITDLSRNMSTLFPEKAAILGAGGAARAVAFALGQRGMEIRLVARKKASAERLIKDLQPHLTTTIEWRPWIRSGFDQARQETGLIVNATPLGMDPDSSTCPWPSDLPLPTTAFIYDLIYQSGETPLMAMARQQNLPACSGLGMLVEQAAESLRRWTGAEPPTEVMFAAARKSLEKANA